MCNVYRADGLGTHPIYSPISCNICVFEVYKGHMGHAILIEPQLFRKHRQVDRRRRSH